MRFAILTTLVVFTFVVAACSAEEPTATPVPTVPPTATSVPTSTPDAEPAVEGTGPVFEEPEQEWITRSDDEEVRLILATPDLAPGTRRFGVVLTDSSGIVAFPVVQLESFKYPEGSHDLADREGPIENALARYFPFPYGTRGIHVTELTFDEAGTWGIEAGVPQPDGSVVKVEVILEVQEETMSVDVGEVPPLSVSRTLADVGDVSDLTTGSRGDESLYQVSVGEALQNGKPTVIVFASPAFCTNAVCGPQVEVLSNLSSEYGDAADFIHVDLFTNPKEIQGDLTRAKLSPLLKEWGLVSQEWTFVMDQDGVVTGRFENFVPEDELVPALELVLDAPESPPIAAPEPATAVPPTETPVTTSAESSQDQDEADPSEPLALEVDASTTWQDVFDALSASEQGCIRDSVDEGTLTVVLERRFIEEREPEPWEDEFFECLEPESVEMVFLSSLLSQTAGMSDGTVACIEGLIDDTDVSKVIEGGKPDASAGSLEVTSKFYGGMMACSLLGMIEDTSVGDEQRACLAQLMTEVDLGKIYLGSQPGADLESSQEFEGFMGGLFICLGDLLQQGLEQGVEALPSQ